MPTYFHKICLQLENQLSRTNLISFCDFLIIAACDYVVLSVMLIHVRRRMIDTLGFSQFLAISASRHFFRLSIFLGYTITVFFQLVHRLGQEQQYAGLSAYFSTFSGTMCIL